MVAASTLEGRLVRLEPLSFAHVDDLVAAVTENRSSYGYTLVPRGDQVHAYVAAQFDRAARGLTPFAQIRQADGRAVGCTAYWDPRPWSGLFPGRSGLRAVEIGFTWLSASSQGCGINAEAKLLLISHAFGTLGVARVDAKTDARNVRCRRALEALGLTFEGVLRNWSASWAPGEDGMLRDSAMYSVIDSEWPAVREGLSRRVARHVAAHTSDQSARA